MLRIGPATRLEVVQTIHAGKRESLQSALWPWLRQLQQFNPRIEIEIDHRGPPYKATLFRRVHVPWWRRIRRA